MPALPETRSPVHGKVKGFGCWAAVARISACCERNIRTLPYTSDHAWGAFQLSSPFMQYPKRAESSFIAGVSFMLNLFVCLPHFVPLPHRKFTTVFVAVSGVSSDLHAGFWILCALHVSSQAEGKQNA